MPGHADICVGVPCATGVAQPDKTSDRGVDCKAYFMDFDPSVSEHSADAEGFFPSFESLRMADS